MKKLLKYFILIMILGSLLLSSGCGWVGYGYFDLTGYNSTVVNNAMASYNTPAKIVSYMANNFTKVDNHAAAWSPEQFYTNKWGDCNDFSTFAIYVAHHVHGYEVYQIHIEYTMSAGKKVAHALGVFVENGKLNYSDNERYDPMQASSYQAIVNDCMIHKNGTLRSWYAMDYDLNKVSEYNMTRSTEVHLPMPSPNQFGTLMGAEAINRYSTIGIYTMVNKTGPALYSGTVQRVRIWANTTLYNCEVATFYVVSGNNLTTRSNQTIGTVQSGAAREINVNLNVQKGDYIGMYYTAGKMDVDVGSSAGLWYLSGQDGIPCTNKTFYFSSNYTISLEGVVITSQ